MATTAQVKKEKRAQAKHELLDASGAVLDGDNATEENAWGVRYTQLSNGKSVSIMPTSDAAKRMLWVLGAKTLATNEASQVRQKNGDDADSIPDIEDRFRLIESGTWVDRTRQGPQWNLDALAEAAVLALVDAGKLDQMDATAVGTKKAAIRALLENPKAVAQVRNVAGVIDHYNALVGKTKVEPKTADDLLALIEG